MAGEVRKYRQTNRGIGADPVTARLKSPPSGRRCCGCYRRRRGCTEPIAQTVGLTLALGAAVTIALAPLWSLFRTRAQCPCLNACELAATILHKCVCAFF